MRQQSFQHPQVTDPKEKMPAWGDEKKLTDPQIADVIAYVMSLNQPQAKRRPQPKEDLRDSVRAELSGVFFVFRLYRLPVMLRRGAPKHLPPQAELTEILRLRFAPAQNDRPPFRDLTE